MLRRYLLSASSVLVLMQLANAQTPGAIVPNASATTSAPVQIVPDSNSPCGDCVVDRHGPWSQIWASFGYARWTMRDAPFATPLVTTGSGANAGALGDPNTLILFGDQPLDFGNFNGLRLDGGVWLNNNHTTGIGFGLTSFGSKSFTSFFDSATTGPAVISRPIFDAQAFQQVGLLVSNGIDVSGSIAFENKAQFYGFDLHVRQNFLNNEVWTIDGILGFRYFNLSESLLITQRSDFEGSQGNSPLVVGQISYAPVMGHPPGPVFSPIAPYELINQVITPTSVNSLLISESFQTRNQIYGVELGTRAEARWGAFYTSFAGKVTLGVNEERINVNGATSGVASDGGATINAPGGILAVGGIAPTAVPFTPTPIGVTPVNNGTPISVGNLGAQRYNQFVVMPEFTFQVGMQVTSHLRLFAGYDWLYINDVVRPGNQINPVINQRYVPSSPAYGTLAGPNAPFNPLSHTDFVAHGFSVGLELQY